MIKKIIIGVVVVTACVWAVRKTHVTSYASTLITQAQEQIHGQIPRDLELARAGHEIKRINSDYQGLLGPVAEKMASVKKLQRDITVARANQQDQRDTLLALTKAIDAKESQVSYCGNTYNSDQAKVKLARDFTNFKRAETFLTSQEKLLEAETKNLAAMREQLDKLIAQKREFEIRLAQLEAEEATLKVVRIQTPLQTDDGRVAEIKNILDRIEHAQNVEQNKHVLMQTYGTRIENAQPNPQANAVNLDEVRDYLQGK